MDRSVTGDKIINKLWKKSFKNNEYTAIGGIIVTVFFARGGYHYSIRRGSDVIFSPYFKGYTTKIDAKICVVNIVLRRYWYIK